MEFCGGLWRGIGELHFGQIGSLSLHLCEEREGTKQAHVLDAPTLSLELVSDFSSAFLHILDNTSL